MKRLSGKWLALLFLLPFAAFFVIFQIAPLAWVALNSLKASDAWSLANYLELFGSPFYRQAIRHSLRSPAGRACSACSSRCSAAIRCATSTAACATSSWPSPT